MSKAKEESTEEVIKLFLGGMSFSCAVRKVGLIFKGSRDPEYRRLHGEAKGRKAAQKAKRCVYFVCLF